MTGQSAQVKLFETIVEGINKRLDNQDTEMRDIKEMLHQVNGSLKTLIELNIEQKNLREALGRAFTKIETLERVLNGVDGQPGMTAKLATLMEAFAEYIWFRRVVLGAIIGEAVAIAAMLMIKA